jgi:glycosyltransferase involved in cell wall biosynthesis
MAESEPALTVAICTRNRRESLLRALASVSEGSAGALASAGWEVLVVDNGSDDGSADAVRELAEYFPVSLEVSIAPAQGLAHARNHALREARGRAIVFIDDDVSVRPGFVAAHQRAFEQHTVVATGGPILPALPPGLAPGWRARLEREIGGPTRRYEFGPLPQEIPGENGLPLPFGANFGVLRALALDLGGFRTDLGWGRRMVPGEETDLLRRVARGPGRILYVPGAVLDHHIGSERARLGYYLRWNRGYGRSLVRFDPPARRAERLRRGGRQLARALLWTLRGRGVDARREQERALGQALELLGL